MSQQPAFDAAVLPAADFTAELRHDALQLVGRVTELRRVRDALEQVSSGVLWLSGAGGIGKSFLTAKVAVDLSHDPRRWCCIAWRFRCADVDRSSRTALLRCAITRLAGWPALGRSDMRPERDSTKLLAQLDELLRAAGQLQAVGTDSQPPRVLFVLDGLDEAARLDPDLLEWPFRFAYPNVVWLCAGRPGEATSRVYAAERCTHLFPDGLPPMTAGDVRAMLYHQLGEQKYELLGLDRRDESGRLTNALVEAIVERSEGLPLYVRFLVEDLLTGHFELTARLKSKLPQGLDAYYQDVLERAHIDDVQGMLPTVLGIIVWAQGPVPVPLLVEVLRRLENVAAPEHERLREDIQEGLRRVASMVRQAPLPEGDRGYEPYHSTIRDHFRASRRLERTNQRVREAFVSLATDWRSVSEPVARRYVLRHGPGHLLDEGRRQDLYALARDAAFLARQEAELPSEPEAPLTTLQAALLTAAGADDAAGMSEFLLRHAERAHALQMESPLTALRQGNLERALRLADVADGERSFMYHLLVAWELCDSGEAEGARQVLSRLVQRKLPPLRTEFGSIAHVILLRLGPGLDSMIAGLAGVLFHTQVYELADALVAQGRIALARSLTGNVTGRQKMEMLAQAQARTDQYEAAVQTARTIDDPKDRAVALRTVGAALTDAGLPGAAKAVFEQAVQAALAIWQGDVRVEQLQLNAAAQVKAGLFQAALQTAQTMENPYHHAEIACLIAAAQARSGHCELALQTAQALNSPHDRMMALEGIAKAQAESGQHEAALQTAQSIDYPYARATALVAIAAAQVEAGQYAVARFTFEQRVRIEPTNDIPSECAKAMVVIATVQAMAGQHDAALQTAQTIDNPIKRAEVLEAIAAAQVNAGQHEATRLTFEQWLTTAQAIEYSGDRDNALRAVAWTQARAGQYEAALQTAQSAGNPAGALLAIAEAQAKAGRQEAALQTAQMIDDPYGRAMALRAIGAAQTEAGQHEAARRAFEQATQTAQAIQSEWNRDDVLRHCAGPGRDGPTRVGAIGFRAGRPNRVRLAFTLPRGTASHR